MILCPAFVDPYDHQAKMLDLDQSPRNTFVAPELGQPPWQVPGLRLDAPEFQPAGPYGAFR